MWYDKYINLPYKHKGDNPETGIDCFNLIGLIYKEQLGIVFPYSTSTFCEESEEDWYNKQLKRYNDPFLQFRDLDLGWVEIKKQTAVYDVATLYIGSTNRINHCALFVEPNRILNIMIDKPSWTAPYGTYYKQYTNGVFRWKTNIIN